MSRFRDWLHGSWPSHWTDAVWPIVLILWAITCCLWVEGWQ